MYSAAIQFEARQKPVSPHDCGLAIAVPLSEKQFLSKLNRDGEGNFVQTFCQERRNLSARGLWSVYEPYADFVRRVVAEAARAGVSIVLDAELHDFEQLTRQREVVTLVAHWRSALFKPADIIDLPSTVAQLTDNESHLNRALKQWGGVSPEAPLSVDAAAICHVLNRYLMAGLLPSDSPPALKALGRTTRLHYEIYSRRQVIDRISSFRGGPSVEFSSGFAGLNDVVTSIPTEFAGLLDLTVCNSVMLAESIRRLRPRCLALANEDLAFLDFRLALYAEVLRNLVRQPEPYEDLVFRIRKELKEIGDESVKSSARSLWRFWTAFR